MTYTKTLSTFGIVAALATTGGALAYSSSQTAAAVPTALAVPRHAAAETANQANDSLTRVARRLQARMQRRFNRNPSLASLRDAVAERRTAFARSINIAFVDQQDDTSVGVWSVSLGKYPDWMTFDPSAPRFSIDETAIESYLAQNAPEGLNAPSFARVTETKQEGAIVRATMEGGVRDGQVFDADVVRAAIVDSYKAGLKGAVVRVQNVRGAVLYDDGTKTHVLHEMGVGRSEFASSPWGRKMNVRKAMNEKANGVLIAPGATFSYNSTLGGPVTYSNGWYDSLIIVNGRDLEPAPGGGICQSATTVFRAAVAAGLPIVTRKSHSLYVHYYKEFGMGLDATVFPGKQDLRFENDTDSPMVLLGSTDEEDNAYSMIYGVDDDRSVVLEGPYFGYTHKEPVMGRTLRSGEVAWVQRVTKTDGTTRDQLLVAQYSGLPRSVALEFEPQLHAAADLVADAQ